MSFRFLIQIQKNCSITVWVFTDERKTFGIKEDNVINVPKLVT